MDIFEIAENEAIETIQISKKHKSLYVSTDHRIKQIDLAMCNRRYDSCFRCVKDPYCGWDQESNVCKPYDLDLLQVRLMFYVCWSLLSKRLNFSILFSTHIHTHTQDVANETNDICDVSVSKQKIIVTYGQSVHLGCFENVPEVLKDQQVTWYHHSKDNGR